MNMKSTGSEMSGTDQTVRTAVTGVNLNRRSCMVGLTLLILLAATWQWDRLVALGIAPLILAVAPCLVMCSLGLCMQRLMGGHCSKTHQQPAQSEPMTGLGSQRRQASAIADTAESSALAESASLGERENALPVNTTKQE